MACFNCTKGYYCQFHRGSTKLVTSIAYSKTYHVFDLINGTNKSIIQRDKDREKNYYIEIEEKTATCTNVIHCLIVKIILLSQNQVPLMFVFAIFALKLNLLMK